MKNHNDHSDEILFSLVQQGDDKAFDVLYNRFFPLLYIHACHKINDKQEARDIVQDTFISLYEKKENIGTIQNFSAYIYVLLKNRILNFIEKSKVRSRYIEHFTFQDSYSHVENYVFEKELENQINAGIELLPDKMRTVFELSRFQQLSHKEIGEQLDISDKTVKRQIVNALKIIRNKITFLFF